MGTQCLLDPGDEVTNVLDRKFPSRFSGPLSVGDEWGMLMMGYIISTSVKKRTYTSHSYSIEALTALYKDVVAPQTAMSSVIVWEHLSHLPERKQACKP